MAKPIGGCIRFTNAGPAWHINTQHKTIGFDTSIAPVITPEGDLYLSLPETMPIITMYVLPDETVARKGITMGPSGGVGGIKVWMNKADGTPLNLADADDYKIIRGELANVWVFALRYEEGIDQ